MKTLLFALALCGACVGQTKPVDCSHGFPPCTGKMLCTCLVPSPHVFESHKDMKEPEKLIRRSLSTETVFLEGAIYQSPPFALPTCQR